MKTTYNTIVLRYVHDRFAEQVAADDIVSHDTAEMMLRDKRRED